MEGRVMGVLDLKVPIMQAPVGSAATARLASEVSRAGGLGALGASWTEPDVLREKIRDINRETDRPFCVNLVLDFEQGERLEVAIEERAPIVSFSFGLRPHLIACARAGGTRVLVQVGSAAAVVRTGGRVRKNPAGAGRLFRGEIATVPTCRQRRQRGGGAGCPAAIARPGRIATTANRRA
jgi:NAD(P)H-dependent flavin oxidoreductase YrpB (nitropropane dioxygenase family)